MEIEEWLSLGAASMASNQVNDEFNVVMEMNAWESVSSGSRINEQDTCLDYDPPELENDDEHEWVSSVDQDWEDNDCPATYIAPPKIGRNEPCICGSGKKYKKCCL